MGSSLCTRPTGPQCCDVLGDVFLLASHGLSVFSCHFSPALLTPFLWFLSPSSPLAAFLPLFSLTFLPVLLHFYCEHRYHLILKKGDLISRPVTCLLNCSTCGCFHFCSIPELFPVTFEFVGFVGTFGFVKMPDVWLLGTLLEQASCRFQQAEHELETATNAHPPPSTYDLQTTLRNLRHFVSFPAYMSIWNICIPSLSWDLQEIFRACSAWHFQSCSINGMLVNELQRKKQENVTASPLLVDYSTVSNGKKGDEGGRVISDCWDMPGGTCQVGQNH